MILTTRFTKIAWCFFVLSTCLSASFSAYSQELNVKIIQLQNRPADEVIKLIKPFVHPKGAVTGTGFKLIVKTTDANLKEIEGILATIDVALRRLLVTVKLEDSASGKESGASVSGRIEISDKSHINAKIYETENRRNTPSTQQIQVLEGQWATINTGVSIPVANRQSNADGTVTETISYKKVTSGFQVQPQINGDRVTIHIRPNQAALSSQGGGALQIQNIDTTVSGKLAEWIDLGGIMQTSEQSGSGILYRTRKRQEMRDRVYVKVEVAP